MASSSRNELALRARVVGLDPTTIPNDSKLEQKVLWLEKKATAVTGTAASTTLTSNATNVSDGDTLTVDTITYTYKTTLGTAPYQIKIGASASASLDNTKAAVTVTGTPGTDYTALTPIHPSVTATTKTATTLLFVARDTNAGGTFASTDTAATLSFPGATFASGTASVAGIIADATTTTGGGAGVSGDKNTSL
jgi:hypothetical protein